MRNLFRRGPSCLAAALARIDDLECRVTALDSEPVSRGWVAALEEEAESRGRRVDREVTALADRVCALEAEVFAPPTEPHVAPVPLGLVRRLAARAGL